jgi:hypothetical protein
VIRTVGSHGVDHGADREERAMQAHAHAYTAAQDPLPLDVDDARRAPAAAGQSGSTPDRAAANPPASPRPESAGSSALTVVGISGDGRHLLCAPTQQPPVADTAASAPRYTLAIDERLRAAIRGELGSAAKGEIAMAPGLRPREIQSRIRAGATVEQVAAAAGSPVDRIEGFAYPVLQERAAVAEKARAAHPRTGSVDTLEEIVTATLADRGQLQDVEWDAFKDERGWVVAVTWRAGRSENRAEWAYAARPGGGSVAALGAEAADLLQPERSQLRPVDELIGRGDGHDAAAGHTPSGHTGAPAGSTEPHAAPPAGGGPGQDSARRPASEAPPARPARRGHRPQMPSWEDVLLGTRTAEH